MQVKARLLASGLNLFSAFPCRVAVGKSYPVTAARPRPILTDFRSPSPGVLPRTYGRATCLNANHFI